MSFIYLKSYFNAVLSRIQPCPCTWSSRYARWLDSHLGSFVCQCARLQELKTAGVRIFCPLSPLKRVECQPLNSRQDAKELEEKASMCFAPRPQVLPCQQVEKFINQMKNGGQNFASALIPIYPMAEKSESLHTVFIVAFFNLTSPQLVFHFFFFFLLKSSCFSFKIA